MVQNFESDQFYILKVSIYYKNLSENQIREFEGEGDFSNFIH